MGISALKELDEMIISAEDFVVRLKAQRVNLGAIADDLEKHIAAGEYHKEMVAANAQSVVNAVEQECGAKLDSITEGQTIIGDALRYFHGTPDPQKEQADQTAEQEKQAA